MQMQIDEQRLSYELEELASFTHAEPAENGMAVTRIVFTEDDLKARAWLKAARSRRGLQSS